MSESAPIAKKSATRLIISLPASGDFAAAADGLLDELLAII